jgi:hypothetical protein
MIRLNDTIRLTPKEKEDLRAISGRPEVPADVVGYNQQLTQAASEWRRTGCAEGELLAWMAEDMKAPT